MKEDIEILARNDYHVTESGKEPTTEKLLTAQEICELLKVRKTYIYWLTHKKQIPFIKMTGHLRFRKSDINAWLELKEVRIEAIDNEFADLDMNDKDLSITIIESFFDVRFDPKPILPEILRFWSVNAE